MEYKPKLSTEGQINHLLSKGVKFELTSIEEATKYLKENNNYFKLRAFRKNYSKQPDGINEGKYINLDFAELQDLSIIDMRLRYILIHLALDVEHFAKIKLIQFVVDSENDGYQIVEDYFSHLKKEDIANDTAFYDSLKKELSRNKDNPYCGGIIEKYDGHYPIWAFVEIIPLGSLIDFYGFVASEFNNRELKNDYYLLKDIKTVRNAAAHSNCIIHNMGEKDQRYSPNYKMQQTIKSISKRTRQSQLSNERTRQVTTLLFAHSEFVKSDGVRHRATKELHEFVDRMYRHIDYYQDSGKENITSTFNFFKNVIDILFPIV